MTRSGTPAPFAHTAIRDMLYLSYDFLNELERMFDGMRTNHVKAKLKRGEPSVGAWLSLPSRASARIMARLGFDWLLIDGEHAAQHPGIVSDMVGIIADAG